MQNEALKTFTIKVSPEEARTRRANLDRLVAGWRGLTDRERLVFRAFVLTGRKAAPKSVVHAALKGKIARKTLIDTVTRLEKLRLLKATIGPADGKGGYSVVYEPALATAAALGIITEDECAAALAAGDARAARPRSGRPRPEESNPKRRLDQRSQP